MTSVFAAPVTPLPRKPWSGTEADYAALRLRYAAYERMNDERRAWYRTVFRPSGLPRLCSECQVRPASQWICTRCARALVNEEWVKRHGMSTTSA